MFCFRTHVSQYAVPFFPNTENDLHPSVPLQASSHRTPDDCFNCPPQIFPWHTLWLATPVKDGAPHAAGTANVHTAIACTGGEASPNP